MDKNVIMKNIFILPLTLLCMLLQKPATAQAAEPGAPRNYFYFGPVDLLFNTLQVGYERRLGNSNTIAFSGGLELSRVNNYYARMGGNGSFQYRVNLLYNKETVSTLLARHSAFAYFAPFIHYRYSELRDELRAEGGGTHLAASYIHSAFGGFGFGTRFSALSNRFCLNVFAGGGLKVSSARGEKAYDSFLQPGYTGIAPKVELQAGIAF